MATLNFIEKELERVYWNSHQKSMPDNPFSNTGGDLKTENITIRAYNWEQNDKPNFETDNIQIWWYKHSNRGVYAKIFGDTSDLQDILTDAIEKADKDFEKLYH